MSNEMRLLLLSILVVLASSTSIVDKLSAEIRSHDGIADKIIDLLTTGAAKGEAYTRLANFTDTVGARVSGSKNLQNAVDYMIAALKADGLGNVHGEEAMIPRWERGQESATLLSPRLYDI